MSTRRSFIKGATVAAAVGRELAAGASEQAGRGDGLAGTGMKTCRIPHSNLIVSQIAYGCASLASWDKNSIGSEEIAAGERIINAAYENGITLFDHADLYAFGKSETLFGEVLKRSPGLRNKIVIQSKCGQRFSEGWQPGDPIHPDLSHKHIVESVEGSLRRLSTDRLDILLLHIADSLVQPEEVAMAFDELHASGKVRYFGVSNYSGRQIGLLKRTVRQHLVVNQIHLGLFYPYPLIEGMDFTLDAVRGADVSQAAYPAVGGGGTFDYCRENEIQVQAWSPVRIPMPSPEGTSERKAATALLADVAKTKGVSPFVLALAWLLKHPARIVPVIGPQAPKHISENCAASLVPLSTEEWYRLLTATVQLKPLTI